MERNYIKPNPLDIKDTWKDDDLMACIMAEVEGAERVQIHRSFDIESDVTVTVWIEHETLKAADDDRSQFHSEVVRLVEIGRGYMFSVRVVIKDSRDDH